MAKQKFNITNIALIVGVAIVALSLIVSTTGFGTSSYTGSPGTPTSQAASCTDSDGNSATTKGICTDGVGRHTDYCNTGANVVEYSCTYNECQPSDPIQCTSGACIDGRCVAA
ncbi:MAG: hypothetical protein J4451_02215 [DPANN group archaeon]|nr:hypothetical protein [DPANN group archaeon]